ncbi:MAG: YfiR family protein [Paucibacter sp.]|nr:YfiR family protein [Roseateles sp.]
MSLALRLLAGLLACWLALGAWAAPTLDDAQLKAAFIYRFAQFTQWPPPPLREFTYCVAGNAAMQASLQALTSKSHGDASSRLRVLTEPQQATQCQLLLLGFDDRAELQRWAAALAAEPVLVVGDSAEAFRNGAVIALVAEPNGLAFRINHTEAKRRGLVLSSQMLKLAREVK